MEDSSSRRWQGLAWLLAITAGMVLLLGACRTTATPESRATEHLAEPSPAPTENTVFESPLATEVTTAQSPLAPPTSEMVRFTIDQPLLAGSGRVTGSGPGGIVLDVVDVTMAGEVLGSGVIDDDNRFDIAVMDPLEAGRMIGIQLGTAREADTWPGLWELRGPDARAVPQVGYFFDTAITK